MSKIKSNAGFRRLVDHLEFETVLDIGCGRGDHTIRFRRNGKKVTPVDIMGHGIDGCVVGDYMNLQFEQHDCAWASHVLEHQLNPNLFLKKVHSDVKEGGYVAITVPPLKQKIVGGHVTLWNMGLVFYHLILAGFDCSNAMGSKYGYNITVIVKKKTISLPKLKYDKGDIETLRRFAPRSINWRQGFNGDMREVNWKV